ncbi:MAG: DNA recombination protein RmuC, partial [Bacteroidaceae bacterium]|nr:DNA recombination protein RmuC [Bacteroidaceae bacterium]
MEILSIAAGLGVGIIIAVVVYIMQDHARYLQQQAHERQLQESRERYERQLQESSEWYERQWQESRERYEKQISDLKAEHARQLAAEQQRREKELAAEMALVKEQMKNTTADILKHRSEELSSANREQIGQIVNPLNEQLRLMKEAVDKNKMTQAETTSALRAQIEEMMRQTTQIGTKADNLARALTSENKTQGNFGEVRLTELLENMGLEKGIHFD